MKIHRWLWIPMKSKMDIKTQQYLVISPLSSLFCKCFVIVHILNADLVRNGCFMKWSLKLNFIFVDWSDSIIFILKWLAIGFVGIGFRTNDRWAVPFLCPTWIYFTKVNRQIYCLPLLEVLIPPNDTCKINI